jgi:hypothetical protein
MIASPPAATSPPAGVPELTEPAATDVADAEAAEPAPPHKTPYAIKHRRPVASGAARAKLDRQRKR